MRVTNEELICRRSQKVMLLLGMLFVLEIFFLIYNSGVVQGMNQRADKLKAYAKAAREDETFLPSDFYDRQGERLTDASWDEKNNGKTQKTWYIDGKAYSQIIGYTGRRQFDLAAKSAEEADLGRDDYRLMAFMDEDYWKDQGAGLYINELQRFHPEIYLTIDHDLQMEVYAALGRQMSESSDRGSAIVMDAKTAEILAMVAFPAYDFNQLQEAKLQMRKDEGKTRLEPAFPITYKGSAAPGSIFKVLTAAALLEHGMEDFTVKDKPYTVDGWTCRNAYTSRGDEINYQKALERSSNVFFSRAALELGEDRLQETARKFMIGIGDYENWRLMDFGEIRVNWDLKPAEGEDSYSPQVLLAQTGFGQGKTEWSTVYAAMVTQAIANDGLMMKPHLVQEYLDGSYDVLYTGKSEVLSEAVSKETADKITDGMLASVAYNCSHHKGMKKTGSILSRYQVAGKTGTAETGDSEASNNAWFISFAPADDPQYVVVVNQCRCRKGGWKMMSTAAEIYQYLFELFDDES